MNAKIVEKARTLLLCAIMVTAAMMPMLSGATDEQLREQDSLKYTMISTSGDVYTEEGEWGYYDVCLDEMPDGVVIITPSSDNTDVEVLPAYLKFSKLNWDECMWFDVMAGGDDDATDTTATISHTIDGTDSIFINSNISDVMVTAYDMDSDIDGDDLPDDLDDDMDGDGVNNSDDAFPEDSYDSEDNDGDGVGDNADMDDDNDGVNDTDDWAPLDDSEQLDTDGDGVGDNSDAFPDDATETDDADGDGVGDNSDVFPTDANESMDSDGDGVGDASDAFENDSTEWNDTDGDGVGDNSDVYPTDSTEDSDTDNDSVGDNEDAFPNDANETMDTDGDGVGDNADTDADNDTVLDSDEISIGVYNGTNFTANCELLVDCDGDGYNDADDAFDIDPDAWDDTDGDGLADSFPNLLTIIDGDSLCYLSVASTDDDSDGDTEEDAECTFTLAAGEEAALRIQTRSWGSETGAKLTYPDGSQTVWAHGSFSSSTYYELGTISDAGEYTLQMYDSYGDGCNGSTTSPCYLEAVLQIMGMPSSTLYGTVIDTDDDGDSWSDVDEGMCGTDSMNNTSVPLDTDGDLTCDIIDDDDDGDGVLDSDEVDGSGLGANGEDVNCVLTVDCDGDGVDDGTDSNDDDASEQSDMDGDGIGDNSDSDRDGDGYGNTNDAFENDSTEWEDSDGDGVGDNADTDDDNDGTADDIDDFPYDADQQFDVDGDGWGNNADMDDDGDGIEDQNDDDDDGDGYSDVDEDTNCVGGNSLTDDVTPNDNDGDMTCDSLDDDDDNDGTDDVDDAFPMDPCADTDTDGDDIPDSLLVNCTTTLVADDDDDYDPSQAPADITECASGWTYAIYSCTFTLSEGDSVMVTLSSYYSTVYSDISITGPSGVLEEYGYGDYYLSLGTFGPYTEAGDYTFYHGAFGGYYILSSYATVTPGSAPIWNDTQEIDCGTDQADSSDEPDDMDGDGICDVLDDDTDGDGTNDTDDAFPLDSTEDTDTDGDGVGDNAECTVTTDTDGDGFCDLIDADDDGDGVNDTDESSGCDLLADCDSDGVNDADEADGTGIGINGADVDCTVTADCDGDTYDDGNDSFPLDSSEWNDTDGDGYGDNDDDLDIDGDGLANAYDACPYDSTEYYDTDGDGICDNADDDDDGDGVSDDEDVAPLDGDESTDWDGDGIGDNSDADDDGDGIDDDVDVDENGESQAYDFDNDGWDDDDEATCGTNMSDTNDVPVDTDDDGLCNDIQDDDNDNDDTNNTNDAFPLDPMGDTDTDGDGMMDSDFEVDFTITTASYSTLTVGVYDIVGNELCMLSTDGAYNGADGNESSCSVEENYIEIVVIDADYYTYFGAFYANYGYSGYGPTDNINVTTDAGTDTYAASYTWYSSSFGDSEYSLDEFYSISENGTMGDMDDDNDGYPDLAETHYCGSSSAKTGYASDSLDNNSTPLDTDGDMICDELDDDDDNDDYSDDDELNNCGTPTNSTNASETPLDTDSDLICDELDDDDDNDGYSDADEDTNCGAEEDTGAPFSDSLDYMDTPPDYDGDMICDELDNDDDGDGTDDVDDDYPMDPCADLDTDGDGLPDGLVDGCTTDLMADDDDDDDGFSDADETSDCGTSSDPLDDASTPLDTDGDMWCDEQDDDDDNDGYMDDDDAFPLHQSSHVDTDGDGMPDFIGDVTEHLGDDFEVGNWTGMDWNAEDAHPNWGWDSMYGEIFLCEDGLPISWFGNNSFVPSYWINDGYVDCNDGSDETVDLESFGPATTGWERSGDVNFGLGTGSLLDGYAVKASGLDANESAILSITIDTNEGILMFDVLISTEERYDELCFYVDGNEEGCASGQEPRESYLDEDGEWLNFMCDEAGIYGDEIPIDWVQDGWDDCGDSDGDGVSDDEDSSLNIWTYAEETAEVYVTAGMHTFEWVYSKDADTDGGADRIYIDNIMFPMAVQGDSDLVLDMDDDNDGTDDVDDACPLDDAEQIDTDGDGFCDNQDSDDDNDGVYDFNDAVPLDPNEQYDFDGDGIGDNADTDDDNDGCLDEEDDLPYDDSSCNDLDMDGIGDEFDVDDDGDNVMDVDDPFPEDGTAWLDNDGDGLPDFNGVPQFAGDFETGSLGDYDTFGDADWSVVDATTSISGAIINGTFSAESGDIDNSQTSSLEIEWTTIAGDMSFEYVTSTESNWDYLRFYLDGALQASWSGQTAGVHVQSITAGTHLFEWQFYKDGSVSTYDDTVWIDDVTLPLVQMSNVNNDTDDDNDGVMDDNDVDPLNPCVSIDTDGDGMPDSVETGMIDMNGAGDEAYMVNCDDSESNPYYADSDDDNDEWSDEDEFACGSDHLNATDMPGDFDNDGLCDVFDDDSDNDLVPDTLDAFPFDYSESVDSDGDGIGDNADPDDDNDNVTDVDDAFPYDANESEDLDGDGVGDNADNDTDGDGVPNDEDSFPTDDDASTDTDGDGIDDEADSDDDGDGEPDVVDWAPLDPAEWTDSDGDGTGDNADTDDDNDGVLDDLDAFPYDSSEYTDLDGDEIGDNSDTDIDGDGVNNNVDAFPEDASESRDLDTDGIGDNADSDRDGDGVSNADDLFPDNSAESVDYDMDGIGDNSDVDDDDDGDLDEFDAFPYDNTEWDDTDADDIGNNADTDDDGDGVTDVEEDQCGSDSLDVNSVPSDYDGDGICDAQDSDVSSDEIKDNTQDDLGWSNAVPGFPALFAAIALVGAAFIGRRNDD